MNTNKNVADCQTVPLFSVYVMWCHKTNMHYVGVTRQKVAKRIRDHKKGTQFVDKQIKASGWEGNWDWWVVEENVPPELISKREQFWVAFFDCVYPKGYNKTCGGISKLTVSDDTRAKNRQRALERDMRGERNPHYGKKHTEEVKSTHAARMQGKNNPMYGKSPTNKGVPWTEERKAEMSVRNSGENNPFYGKHHTEEAKERNRQAHLGKPAVRGEKHYMYGKHHSEKTKAKMREKALAREAAKRAAKAVAEENLAAANSTPTSLSTLSDAVIF